MLIDTHCHINIMVKKNFDVPLTNHEIESARTIIKNAQQANVSRIINVGTSVIESINCVTLAQQYESLYATVGIHPNDCTTTWQEDIKLLKKIINEDDKKVIVGIGECGLDKHYPDYNLPRQQDAFRSQIELALYHQLPLVVHTRDAADETLSMIDEYAREPLRGVIHCFSEDLSFAQEVIKRGFVIGLGGTITYPKNELLRTVATTVSLDHIILETDAPFLPPQEIRGKQNNPAQIATIAYFLAELRHEPLEVIAEKTTRNASLLFNLDARKCA